MLGIIRQDRDEHREAEHIDKRDAKDRNERFVHVDVSTGRRVLPAYGARERQ